MNLFAQKGRTPVLFITIALFCVCAKAPLVRNGENQNADAATEQVIKKSAAVYMAGTEPPALKGAHKVIGSELAKALTSSNTYSAVDRTDDVLKVIEKEHVYQRSGNVDDAQIKELGKQLGVRFLCIAEVNEVMDSYHLDARLVDVETAEVISVVSKPGAMRDVYQVAETARDAGRELVGGQRK